MDTDPVEFHIGVDSLRIPYHGGIGLEIGQDSDVVPVMEFDVLSEFLKVAEIQHGNITTNDNIS